MTTNRAALFAVLAIFAAACGGAPPGGDSLDGREFLSLSVTVGGVERPLVPGTRMRITFRDGSVSASAGCNHMSGGYRLEGGRLVVDQMGMTEMGCDPDRHAQDEWLAALLGARPALALADNRLTIDAGETVVRLVDREIAEPDLPLVGTTWALTSIIVFDGVSSVPEGVISTIAFGSDGALAIQPGCNSGSGSYEAVGGRIRFSDIGLTRMACPGAPGEVEAAVVAVIAGAEVEYRIDSGVLTLQAGEHGLQYTGNSTTGP